MADPPRDTIFTSPGAVATLPLGSIASAMAPPFELMRTVHWEGESRSEIPPLVIEHP
jgi:hypothetical protein